MRSTILPVVVSCFGKAGHRFFHVLLCNLALRFAHKVDDPLVCFQVLVPRRSCLPAGRDSHTHERKERHKKTATLLDNKRVAGKFTEPEVELKIILEQRFAISLICRPSHLLTNPSIAKMLMASRIEPCATPNFWAHFPSTMRTPLGSEPFMISVRKRSAKSCLTKPFPVSEE